MEQVLANQPKRAYIPIGTLRADLVDILGNTAYDLRGKRCDVNEKVEIDTKNGRVNADGQLLASTDGHLPASAGQHLPISPDGYSNERLINLAYSLAIEPQRLRTLTQALFDRLEIINADRGLDDGTDGEKLDDVANHFAQASDLIERQGRRFNTATGSKQFIDLDTRPSLLLQKNGDIFYTNQAARDELRITGDNLLSPMQFEPGQYEALIKDLAALGTYEVDKLISVYDLRGSDGVPKKMALSKSLDYFGKALGRLYTFHLKWLPEQGRQFQDGFGLTDVDLAITEALVKGIGLKELAKKRGRSLGTLRNQSKALIAKLGLHSQTELICLFSGFTTLIQSDPAVIDKPDLLSEPWRTIAFMELPGSPNQPNGRKMQYEMAGPLDGRPVLFFHALIGGCILTKAMRAELAARKIRLIMVWRPHFAGTSADANLKGNTRGEPERFAADIEKLLGHLKIEQCQILAQITGSIYAYACAQKLGSKIIGIVNCAGCVPILSRADFKKMEQTFRVVAYLGRYTPKLLPMLMRGMLAKIDAGFDVEVTDEIFLHSPHDLAVLHDPETKALMRAAYPNYTANSTLTFAVDVPLLASKWQHLLRGVNCPVTLVHGKNDPAYPHALISQFVQDKPNFNLITLENTGQLGLYQHPEAAFGALDAQLDTHKSDPEISAIAL